MSGVQSINAITYNKHFLRADNTGYAALVGMGLTSASMMTKSKFARKCHKPLAYTTVGLTLLHLGVITYNRLEWERKQKEFIA